MFKSLESDENDLPKFFSRLQDDRFDNIEKKIYLFSNRPIDAVCGSSMTPSLSSFQENKLFESVTKCTFRFVGLTSSFSILYSCLLIFTFWYKRVVFSQLKTSQRLLCFLSVFPEFWLGLTLFWSDGVVRWMILSRKDPLFQFIEMGIQIVICIPKRSLNSFLVQRALSV